MKPTLPLNLILTLLLGTTLLPKAALAHAEEFHPAPASPPAETEEVLTSDSAEEEESNVPAAPGQPQPASTPSPNSIPSGLGESILFFIVATPLGLYLTRK